MLKSILKNLSNIPGWRTNRKIVIIESDDWGSIRMPSNFVRETLETKYVSMGDQERQRYTKYDTLANEADFEALYETLTQFKDINGKHPVFTAVSVVANPDFDKIKEANFEKYFYEPFNTTLERYGHENTFKMWQEGKAQNLFVPQFHGREHLNVLVWMRQLRAKESSTMEAFKLNCWGFENKNKFNIDYQAAFDLELPSDVVDQKTVIQKGLEMFEQIHGYKADFFVPPNGPFNNKLEMTAALSGIKYMSTSKIQSEPQGQGIQKKRLHYLGQKNASGQLYITRNCFFEPSAPGKDWVSSCMNDIENAFKWGKPAVISSHRVNFIGGIVENNRTNSLAALTTLLTQIQTHWPNVEFMTSSDLGDVITKSRK
ncbi:polysaccharide (de)acetylase [Flavobacterium sp. Arc2]|uniref:polysaccharide (de)acetylase n=1 Tax=Flavobacterium sp. Arc2 TaxID=3046685 RepID=UPI00352C9868